MCVMSPPMMISHPGATDHTALALGWTDGRVRSDGLRDVWRSEYREELLSINLIHPLSIYIRECLFVDERACAAAIASELIRERIIMASCQHNRPAIMQSVAYGRFSILWHVCSAAISGFLLCVPRQSKQLSAGPSVCACHCMQIGDAHFRNFFLHFIAIYKHVVSVTTLCSYLIKSLLQATNRWSIRRRRR